MSKPASPRKIIPPGVWPTPAQGWYAVAALTFAHFVSYLDRTIISLLVEPIKASQQLSDTQVSFLLGFAFAVFYALAGIPLGYLADRSRRKRLILASIGIWSLMTAACGLAKGFWGLFLARVGVGVGEAGLNPAAISLISDCFPPRKRHFPVATFMVGGTLGGGLAIILGAGLVSLGERLTFTPLPLLGILEPWQWVFVLVSLLGLPALLLAAGVREPARKGLLQASDSGAAVNAYLRRHWRCLAGLFVGTSLILMVNVCYLVWGPTLFVRVHGLTLQQAGLMVGLPCFVAGIAGNFVAPAIARRLGRGGRQDAPLLTIQLVALLVALPMVLGPLLPTPLAVIATVAPAIGLMVGSASVVQIAAQQILPNQLRARAVAFYNLAVNALAFGLGPLLIGLLSDRLYADEKLLHYSIATLALAAIPLALLVLARTRRHFLAAAADARDWSPT
ncbi:MFS transporter [Stutzerimonas kirkiae]|nr:MFS transporter [Stutzerimonas kirkiae]